MPTSMKRLKGFTLVELMVTLAVIAILASIAGPSFNNIRDRSRVRAAAEAIYAHLQFARSESIKQNRDLVVGVVAGATWCLSISNATGCDCGTTTCQFGPPTNLAEHTLRSTDFSGISIATNQNDVIFESRRGMSNGVSITINGANSLSIDVIVSSRGRVRACSTTVGGYTCSSI